MNCQDFERIILALARQQLLDAAMREQCLAHAEDCARCAARLAEEQTLIAGVRQVVAEMAQVEAPARVEAALLTAFREHATSATAPIAPTMPAKNMHWPQWMLGAAAVILVLVSVGSIFWLRSGSPPQEPAANAILPKATGSGESTSSRVNPATDDGPKTPQSPMTSPRRHHPRQSNLSEAEVTTSFFPLIAGDDLDSLEGVQVVRVELPGSALLEVGLPVDAAMASKPVKADVVLGHDGIAYAIRFVLKARSAINTAGEATNDARHD